MANVRVHPDWPACRRVLGPRRFAFTTQASATHAGTRFEPGDAFVFGPESVGLGEGILGEFAPERRLRIPMIPGNRSLNLSNAVAVAVYEAWRQNGFSYG
jgi:tRNA (cytidine/uridine-2'-O-)-methyltransferase